MKHVEQGADRRGLAGAVGTEEAEDLPCLDREGHVLDAPRLAVELGQAIGLDYRHALMLSADFSSRETKSHPCPTVALTEPQVVTRTGGSQGAATFYWVEARRPLCSP